MAAASLAQQSLDRITLERTMAELATAIAAVVGSLTSEQLVDVEQCLGRIVREQTVPASASRRRRTA
jgi:hypothetical protein